VNGLHENLEGRNSLDFITAYSVGQFFCVVSLVGLTEIDLLMSKVSFRGKVAAGNDAIPKLPYCT